MIYLTLMLYIFVPIKCKAWEFCQSEIQNELCGELTHYVCDPKNSISEVSGCASLYVQQIATY